LADQIQDSLFARAVEKFVNVDGNLGRTVMPFPFNAYWNKDVFKYATLSVAERIAQISHDLSSDERHAVEAFVLLCSGGTTENSAFLDFLRWWAAANYDYKTLLDTIIVFKLKCGQSGFAKRFFEEALTSGNLSYSFNTPVALIDSSKGVVEVRTKDGQILSAKKVICTAPLNVLEKIEFNPPLDQAKREAAALKHVNQCVKVHADIKDPEMRSWSGVTYPHNKLVIGVADGTTPAGKTHCVFFGCDANHMHADEDINQTLAAVKEFGPMEVDRLVSEKAIQNLRPTGLTKLHCRSFIIGPRMNLPTEHGKEIALQVTALFLTVSRVWYRPGMEVQYLEALRKRQGPVLFANSDWAAGGWRSFIDGAIQSGTEAALTVRQELRRPVSRASRL
jgi:hypothetical protein